MTTMITTDADTLTTVQKVRPKYCKWETIRRDSNIMLLWTALVSVSVLYL